jgi:6-pyruvoyl-tetrahydropterin synthase
MILDFKDLKEAMNTVLDPLDHALVLAHDDPLVATRTKDEVLELFKATNGKDPRLFIWPDNPTAESFADYALRVIQAILCHKGITITKVRVWETATSYAEVTNE